MSQVPSSRCSEDPTTALLDNAEEWPLRYRVPGYLYMLADKKRLAFREEKWLAQGHTETMRKSPDSMQICHYRAK